MPFKLVCELWTRLICLSCITALLVLALSILTDIDGWWAYETTRQLCAEIGARVALTLGLAIVVGTATSLLMLPYIFWRQSAAIVRCEAAVRTAALIAFIVCGSAIIGIAIRWGTVVGLLPLTNRTSIYVWEGFSCVLLVGTLVCYFVMRRDAWAGRLAHSVSGRTTRRLLLFAGVGGLLTGLSSEIEPRGRADRPRSASSARPAPNLLLVTFDALSAEDVSCLGYHLPTTPNIDALAQSSYVFSNHYACSTFTTPSIISMLTGCYPSSTRVYHYGGSLRGVAAARTLPNVLRANGYATAASVANPGAHPDCLGFGEHFDILPPCPLKDFATRNAAALFHSAQLATDVGRAANFVPYMLEQLSPHTFGEVHSTFPPEMSFRQAERILNGLSGPYFMWVHVFAPHFPYLPEAPYLHRFLGTDELRTHAQFADMVDRTGYSYSPAKQPLVDKGRLRYDEWIAQADGAFGEFMGTLRRSGRLNDMAVVVSSDHGESFQGGYLGHGGGQQLRPILHVPLMIHLPNQTSRQDVDAAIDQTALAPTLLQIAGVERPDWMDGRPVLNSAGAAVSSRESRAFTQYFVPNSAFKPVTRGSIGVIDGRHQYVRDVAKRTGSLFDLAEAQDQLHDLSHTEPALAAELYAQIERHFPQIVRMPPAQA